MVHYLAYALIVIFFLSVLIYLMVGLNSTTQSTVTMAENQFEFPIFIINLDRKPERYSYVTNQLDSLGLSNYQKISGVDGFQSERNELVAYGLQYEFTERRGLAGCAASHIKVWQHIVDKKLDWCLVLEDDAHFHPDFVTLFPQYWNKVPKNAKIVFPGYCTDENNLPSTTIVEKSVMCLQAYMISQQGAKYLLDNLLPIEDPIDIVIDKHFSNHPGSYIFNGNVMVNGIRPNDYKEANGRRCMFNGIVYQNHEEQGSTIHQYDTVF